MLSRQLQSFREVVRVINEIRNVEITVQLKSRILRHLIAYAEYQFGNRIGGKTCRERINGEIIEQDDYWILEGLEQADNFEVEIYQLFNLHDDLITIYEHDESLSWIARDNLRLPYCVKALELLQPWSAYPDLTSTPRRIDGLDMDKMNHILMQLSISERRIAEIRKRRNEFHLAGHHCQRELFYARLYDGIKTEKIPILCSALRTSQDLQAIMGNNVNALSLAQEAYDCCTTAYNPVHSEVQQAAGTLIECLFHKGDFCHAERLAQLTLDNLTNPKNGMNQESEAVATGYASLAKVKSAKAILYIGGNSGRDSEKAEVLARESLRIRTQLFHHDDRWIGDIVGILASSLLSQDKLGCETKELNERAIAIQTRHCGPDGSNTAVAYRRLSDFHLKLSEIQKSAETRREQLRLSQAKVKESVRIYTKILGPINPKTLNASSQLSMISRELSGA
jgi:hypothetical protein